MATIKFPPTPDEDPVKGLNDNAYESRTYDVSYGEKLAFLGSISKDVEVIALSKGLPASAILAMAALESGWGNTRTAVYANNIFGIMNWGRKTKSRYSTEVYQLKGQPDENGGKNKILKVLPTGQKLFDEASRPDNLYMKFATYADAIKCLVNEWIVEDFMNKNYPEVVKKYRANLKPMGKLAASKQFLFDLAENGYCSRGGDYYRKNVGAIIDQFHLDLMD
jgi:hypothetical protein